MSTPQPINAVQTRVVKTQDGVFCPQFSTDGMTWFPLVHDYDDHFDAVVCTCEDFQSRADCLPDQGEVVWRSKK
jgi:hypothetical protein